MIAHAVEEIEMPYFACASGEELGETGEIKLKEASSSTTKVGVESSTFAIV